MSAFSLCGHQFPLIGCKVRTSIFRLIPKFSPKNGFSAKLLMGSMDFTGKLTTCPENQDGLRRYLDNILKE